MTDPTTTECKIIPFPEKQQDIDPDRLQALLNSFDYCEYFPLGENLRLVESVKASVVLLRPNNKE